MVATIFFSLALSSSVSMDNLSSSVATIFSRLVFVFRRLLSCLVAVSLQGIFITPLQSFENSQALILVVFRSFSRLILSLSFLCSSVYEALFALSFSFLSERFSSVHAKAVLALVEMNNTGRILLPNTDFEHARV